MLLHSILGYLLPPIPPSQSQFLHKLKWHLKMHHHSQFHPSTTSSAYLILRQEPLSSSPPLRKNTFTNVYSYICMIHMGHIPCQMCRCLKKFFVVR